MPAVENPDLEELTSIDVASVMNALASVMILNDTLTTTGLSAYDTVPYGGGALEVYPGPTYPDENEMAGVLNPVLISYPSRPYMTFDLPDIGGLSGNFRYHYFSRNEEIYSNPKDDPDIHPRKYDAYGPARECVLYLENSIAQLATDDVLGDYIRANFVNNPAGWFYLDLEGMSTEPLFSLENMRNTMSELHLQNGAFAQLNLFTPDSHGIAVKEISPNASLANSYDFWLSQINVCGSQGASGTASTLMSSYPSATETEKYYELSSGQQLTTAEDDFPDLGRVIDFNYHIGPHMFLSSQANPGNPYQCRYIEEEEAVTAAHTDAALRSFPDFIDPAEWSVELTEINLHFDQNEPAMVEQSTLDAAEMNENGFAILGYYVKKWEIAGPENAPGTFYSSPKPKDPLVFFRKNDYEIVDERVRYGATYRYTVHIMGWAQFVDQDAGPSTGRAILISKDSRTITIKCEEKMPPQPPEWMGFHYFPGIEGNPDTVKIIWDQPIEFSQNGCWINDIKAVQIFQRRARFGSFSGNPGNTGRDDNGGDPLKDAFELIGLISYNDLATAEPLEIRSYEIPCTQYIPVTFSPYLVNSFTVPIEKDVDYIFTLAALDARGHSSCYGPQYKVRFISEKNYLEVKFVCEKGAPKNYPNYLLKNTALQPVAKLSGYKRMKIYYCPDYTHLIYNSNAENDWNSGEPLEKPLANETEPPNYSIQFIDIGLSKEQRVDIKVVRKDGES